jgi:cobalt/nickel transport system permease protein
MIHSHDHHSHGHHSHNHQKAIHQSSDDDFFQIAPPVRVLCALMMVLAIGITPNGHWVTGLIYGIGIALVLFSSPVNLAKLCQRLAVESVFVSVAVIGLLFRDGEGLLWQWGGLKITMTGLVILGSVMGKLCLSLMVMNLLTMTMPIPVLLESLSILKVSPLLIAILASMHRYLDLLIDEFMTMRRAAIARNLMAGKRWQRLVIGNMIGSLFIRTYDRGDRIHQAMLSRGYQGVVVSNRPVKFRRRDRFALLITILFSIFGQLAFYLV